MNSKANKVILSLFDYSGSWSQPYRKAGYTVITIDIKRGQDVFEVMEEVLYLSVDGPVTVYGVLAAPPCTDFAVSGSWCWNKKETQPAAYISRRTCLTFENTVELSIALVLATLEIITRLNPVFWALENPVGRISKLIPELGQPWYFQPWQFGDPWTKKTGLWGKFNKPAYTPVQPLKYCKQGSWTQKLGGKSERTKELRSITPAGFARAFYLSNQ